MRVAYFDCFSGASGNMIVGALVDAGLSLDALERELRRLPVSGWSIEARPVRKCGLGATYVDVRVPGEDHAPEAHGEHASHGAAHAHRSLARVIEVLRHAGFPPAVERAASAIYHRLGTAEARVHRMPIDEIAFHEVGQIDAIVDVAAAALGLFMLGIERVYCSPLPCGRGFITASHGRLPSPAPATLELLRGVPTYDIDVDGELVTPTGAAILTTVASFEQRPPMTVSGIGYGAGRSEFPFANVMRVLVGEAGEAHRPAAPHGPGVVTVLETDIDDMNPQLFDNAADRLFAAGALDVWTHPVQMKKGRPGTQLCVLAPPERADALADVILAETTTIGLRRWNVTRDVLPREEHTVATSLGDVRVKVVSSPAGARARAEYEDCRSIAQRDGMPLADVMRRVDADVEAWLAKRTN